VNFWGGCIIGCCSDVLFRLENNTDSGQIFEMNTTVIVTSYRRRDALNLVLQSLANQTEMPEEVIVADDGSGPDVRSLIDHWSERLPLAFIWQADRKFRAARARNLAVVKAKGDHLIFIDGDCVLPPDFVKTHRRLITDRKMVSGGRFLINSQDTKAVVSSGIVDENLCFRDIKFLKLPLGFLRDLTPGSWRQARTCNLGVMKPDFMNVGGFDELYQGWGREDSDLVVRMIKDGVKIRSARFAACVSHLHHNEEARAALEANDTQFQNVIADRSKVMPAHSVLRLL